METEKKPPLKRTKKLTSVVWNDFERVKKGDMMVAICKHCQKKLSGSSTSGTSHLRNHLKRCLRRSNGDISQRLVVREKKKDGAIDLRSIKFETETPYLKFDQERSRLDLAHMVILHGYPLSIVEDVGFRRFVLNLQPLFQVMSCDTTKADCMKIYENEKQKLSETLNKLPSRISLTAEVWSSRTGSKFLCLIAYFIDEAWKLGRKILNFVVVANDTEEVLSEAIMTCLLDWGIECKLFSITIDALSNVDSGIFRLKDQLSQNRSIQHNAQLFHVRCASRIMNSIVEDVLEELNEVTHKIRETIRYVNSSEQTKQKFSEIAREVCQSQKSLFIDSPAQWTSTCHMLEAAIEYREVFSRLQEGDSSYDLALSDTEWEKTIALTNYLKLIVEVTSVFSGAKYPTANIYFPEICDIHLKLIEWCKSTDSGIASMATKMKEKFDSYWSVSGINLTLAVVLDPRFKMKLVEYYFGQMFETNAPTCIQEVIGRITDLFQEYSTRSLLPSLDLQDQDENMSEVNGVFQPRDRLSGYDKFLHETSSSPHLKSDLDKYLEEPIFPRSGDFDILDWWKVNSPKYPVLSVMARDILGISMSIADSSASVYDAGDKTLDMQHSELSPDVLEALICSHDWLRTEFESEWHAHNSSGSLRSGGK